MRDLGVDDAWQHTLNMLSGNPACRSTRRGNMHNHRPSDTPGGLNQSATQPAPAHHAHLAIVETWSDNLVSMSWSDPTSGRYTEQPWRLFIARKCGVCALTGAAIRRGDRIYRPLSRKLRSINADWVVLASALMQAQP